MEDQQADLEKEFRRRIGEHLLFIYPDQPVDPLIERLAEEIGMGRNLQSPVPHSNNWSEEDCVLITYGNTIKNDAEKPLHTLHRFLNNYLDGVINTVHILPFFPFSSDDGFSVMDYLEVNPALGDWEDIEAISKQYKLMADLVINHMSSRSLWFDNFKKRLDPGKDYFCEADPEADLSKVVRPRNSPLLTEVETSDGIRHVWCTFSADQVDLNFKNPKVLIEFVRIILETNGYDVCCAYNADQGLALLRTESPDIVLLDIMMSYSLAGLEVTRTMHKDLELAKIPLIVISSVLPSL